MTELFSRDFVSIDTKLATLALVVPNLHSELQSHVFIGMNTLEALYNQYMGSEHASFQPAMQGYQAVL